MSVNERLKQWLEGRKNEYGETQTFLGEKLGYKKAYFSGVKNGKDKVNLEFVQSVLNYDAHINARWLLLGEGKMYKDETYNKDEDVFRFNNVIIEKQTILLKKIEESKDSQILDLKAQIVFLKKIIDEKL